MLRIMQPTSVSNYLSSIIYYQESKTISEPPPSKMSEAMNTISDLIADNQKAISVAVSYL